MTMKFHFNCARIGPIIEDTARSLNNGCQAKAGLRQMGRN